MSWILEIFCLFLIVVRLDVAQESFTFGFYIVPHVAVDRIVRERADFLYRVDDCGMHWSGGV